MNPTNFHPVKFRKNSEVDLTGATISSNSTIAPNPVKLLLTLLLITSFIVVFLPVWKNLIHAWSSSEEYSHGFFIIPICIYIIWQKKDRLSQIPPIPSRWGLLVVIFSLLLYLFAYFAEISTVTSFSMVPAACGILLYLYGFEITRLLLFPLFLLLFMIPVPAQVFSTLTVPLQLVVSASSTFLASLLDIPIYREGNVLHLPEKTLAVVHACSGLRSLISIITLSVVYGYFTLNSNLLRCVLVFSGIPAAILVNILRVLIMVLSFYYFNYDLTTGSVHTVFGVFIFFLAILFIVFIKGIISRWGRSPIPE